MIRETEVSYIASGHETLQQALLEKHGLQPLQSFHNGHTACMVTRTQSGEKAFVKTKGYLRNKNNMARFHRAVAANRMASRIPADIAPRILDFQAFERDNVLWLNTLTVYAGKPFSRGMFFEGDVATVSDEMIAHIRRTWQVVSETPVLSIFYPPQMVADWIGKAFGAQSMRAAAKWTSAHCDFHWGNILSDGARVVDWDMFSLAPKGFDAANFMLFSVNEPVLFERLYVALSDILADHSVQVAVLFAGSRILRLMRLPSFAHLRVHEQQIHAAVKRLVPGLATE